MYHRSEKYLIWLIFVSNLSKIVGLLWFNLGIFKNINPAQSSYLWDTSKCVPSSPSCYEAVWKVKSNWYIRLCCYIELVNLVALHFISTNFGVLMHALISDWIFACMFVGKYFILHKMVSLVFKVIHVNRSNKLNLNNTSMIFKTTSFLQC